MSAAPAVDLRRAQLAALLIEALAAEACAERNLEAIEIQHENAVCALQSAQKDVRSLEKQLGFEGGEPEYLALVERRGDDA